MHDVFGWTPQQGSNRCWVETSQSPALVHPNDWHIWITTLLKNHVIGIDSLGYSICAFPLQINTHIEKKTYNPKAQVHWNDRTRLQKCAWTQAQQRLSQNMWTQVKWPCHPWLWGWHGGNRSHSWKASAGRTWLLKSASFLASVLVQHVWCRSHWCRTTSLCVDRLWSPKLLVDCPKSSGIVSSSLLSLLGDARNKATHILCQTTGSIVYWLWCVMVISMSCAVLYDIDCGANRIYWKTTMLNYNLDKDKLKT